MSRLVINEEARDEAGCTRMTARYEAYQKVHPDRRKELEERAAILEYRANINREKAEDLAVAILDKKYGGKK